MNYCKDCCFYVPTSGVEPEGECHRYPPTILRMKGSIHTHFPYMEDSDWCGEFQSNIQTDTNVEPRPSFEKFYSTVESDILCSCGDIIQSRQQVYSHWQQGHITVL